MFCGTRDLLAPGCRLLAGRAAAAGWDLTYVERPDLLHVYPLLPFVPEARARPRQLEFLLDDDHGLAFADLDPRTAYDVWRLRQDVFVVEQECPYPDLDGRDLEPGTRHVLRPRRRRAGRLRAGARRRRPRRIGRVVLAPPARGRGLRRRSWTPRSRASATATSCWTPRPRSPAGTPFGFEVTGAEFLEDGIPHVPMRRR